MNRIVFCLFLSLIIDLGSLFELIAGRDRINNYALKQSVCYTLYYYQLCLIFVLSFFRQSSACAAVCFQRVELYIYISKKDCSSSSSSCCIFYPMLFLERLNCFNSTTTIIILIIIIVCRNRFFREWKKKMDYGRCVIGMQSIPITIPICPIPINFGLFTFKLNQDVNITVYSPSFTLCDHTID